MAAASLVLGELGGGPLTAPERLPLAAPGERYEVRPGDTYWEIAARLAPGADPRPIVDQLVFDNGGSAHLVAGELIALPSSEAS